MNILAIIVSMIGLQVIIFQFNIYKLWYLNVLEASFIINLLVLAIGTYYLELSGGTRMLSLTLQLVWPLLPSVA